MPTAKHEFEGVFADLLEEVGPHDPFVVTKDIKLGMPTRAVLKQFYKTEQDIDARMRVLIGDDLFDKVEALFEDKPHQMWAKFIDMYLEYVFGKGSTKVEGN